MGDLDRRVLGRIDFGGQTMPTQVIDKGALGLDLKNDGKPGAISDMREVDTVDLKGAGDRPRP